MPVITLDTLVARIRDTCTAGPTCVVAIDGPSGSGKTTLADRISPLLDAPVVRMDHLYPGWDGLAEGARNVADEVIIPLATGHPATYRRWGWHRGEYADVVDVPPASLVLVEGCGSGSTPGAPYLSMLLWLDAPAGVRHRRGLDRDGDAFRPHWNRWARQEEALFAAERTEQRADLRIDTFGPGSSDSELVLHLR